jgi:predicted peroxiredoxin
MEEGQLLELVTDDYEPLKRDIVAWCDAVGHRMVTTTPTADGLRFLIQKGPTKSTDASLAAIVSSDGLEELLSPLGFALAAALEGMAVHLYIQGPAVRILTRGFQPKLRGWARPFSRFAAAGLTKAGHLPAQEKLRQLRSLDARLYLCGPSMQHFKVKPDDLIFDDIPVVEYLSFIATMNNATIHIYT